MNEEYIFNYKNTTWDFWLLMIYNTYESLLGICNIVFTFAMVIVAIRFWNTTPDVVQTLLAVACVFFPIIQPILLYLKAKSIAENAPKISLIFHEDGIRIKSKNERADLTWDQMECVKRRPNMLILFLTKTNAFMLPNRVIGKERRGNQEFYHFISEKSKNRAW